MLHAHLHPQKISTIKTDTQDQYENSGLNGTKLLSLVHRVKYTPSQHFISSAAQLISQFVNIHQAATRKLSAFSAKKSLSFCNL